MVACIDKVDSEFRDTDPEHIGEVEMSHPEGDKRKLLITSNRLLKTYT